MPLSKTQQQSTRDAYLERFMIGLKRRNRGQPEFHQAVHEFARDVVPFLEDKQAYKDAHILDRMTEPDRVIVFSRVLGPTTQTTSGSIEALASSSTIQSALIKAVSDFTRTSTFSILKFLGFEQVFKNSLTTLPMGGGKGGANFNPHGKSDGEVMRFCQAFMTELYRHIGPNTDIPAGDIGVGAREVSYLFGQYKRLRNEFTGTITGKGLAFGGSLIRTEATGYGCVYFAREMLGTRGDDIRTKTCLVSGSGNVAQYTAEKLLHLGGKVVHYVPTLAASSMIQMEIDEEKLAWIIDLKTVKRGRISEYVEKWGGEYHEGKRPWSVPCDLAFPCATQNELDEDDAKTLVANGCHLVSEGANMPSSIEAINVFLDNKLLFGPAKAANAGGVCGQWPRNNPRNAMRLSWSREEVDSQLLDINEEDSRFLCRSGQGRRLHQLREGRQHRRLCQSCRCNVGLRSPTDHSLNLIMAKAASEIPTLSSPHDLSLPVRPVDQTPPASRET